jgi:hypothetical protein
MFWNGRGEGFAGGPESKTGENQRKSRSYWSNVPLQGIAPRVPSLSAREPIGDQKNRRKEKGS